ncbi:MAG: ribonuclease Z [Desulfobacterales bacterium]|nr:ribonuclease Z [Desulfobacterales bacterium]
MRPSFHPRLVNSPLDDPGLVVGFSFENRSLMFDAGDTAPLSSRELLKVSHLFISHTHMDHFIGFDRILRLFLGRPAKLHVFGPAGFLANLEGKLAAYTWNLVSTYTGKLTLGATEVRADRTLTRHYDCRSRFRPDHAPKEAPFTGVLLEEPGLTVTAAILDHGDIPCLAFCLTERFHVNIRKTALESMGLSVGPWLADFKQALFEGRPPDTPIEVPMADDRPPDRYLLGELSDRIAHTSPGQKIAYVVDADYTPANEAAIVAMAQTCDHLFIEAAFLDRDADQAAAKHHLTAHQAGTIARKARAGGLTVCHFSPRYADQPHLLTEEALVAFRGDSPL